MNPQYVVLLVVILFIFVVSLLRILYIVIDQNIRDKRNIQAVETLKPRSRSSTFLNGSIKSLASNPQKLNPLIEWISETPLAPSQQGPDHGTFLEQNDDCDETSTPAMPMQRHRVNTLEPGFRRCLPTNDTEIQLSEVVKKLSNSEIGNPSEQKSTDSLSQSDSTSPVDILVSEHIDIGNVDVTNDAKALKSIYEDTEPDDIRYEDRNKGSPLGDEKVEPSLSAFLEHNDSCDKEVSTTRRYRKNTLEPGFRECMTSCDTDIQLLEVVKKLSDSRKLSDVSTSALFSCDMESTDLNQEGKGILDERNTNENEETLEETNFEANFEKYLASRNVQIIQQTSSDIIRNQMLETTNNQQVDRVEYSLETAIAFSSETNV